MCRSRSYESACRRFSSIAAGSIDVTITNSTVFENAGPGVNGLIGELVSKGDLDFPIVVRSHGGRARSLVAGDVPVDVTIELVRHVSVGGQLDLGRFASAANIPAD